MCNDGLESCQRPEEITLPADSILVKGTENTEPAATYLEKKQ